MTRKMIINLFLGWFDMFKIAICRGSAGYLVVNATALTKPTFLLDFLRSSPDACIVEPSIAYKKKEMRFLMFSQ